MARLDSIVDLAGVDKDSVGGTVVKTSQPTSGSVMINVFLRRSSIFYSQSKVCASEGCAIYTLKREREKNEKQKQNTTGNKKKAKLQGIRKRYERNTVGTDQNRLV